MKGLSQGMTLELGGGTGDSVDFTNAAATATLLDVEAVTGGVSVQAITITNSVDMAIDLLAGDDSLTLNGSGNHDHCDQHRNVTGGAGVDLITLGAAYVGGTFDGLGGNDSLTTAAGGATVTLASIETVTGAAGNDVITFNAAASVSKSTSRPATTR